MLLLAFFITENMQVKNMRGYAAMRQISQRYICSDSYVTLAHKELAPQHWSSQWHEEKGK